MHTVPAVAALRASQPRARIDWVVDSKWASVLEGSPALNDVIAFDRRSLFSAARCVQSLRAKRYTCAIDFQGLYKSSLLGWLSGVGRRIGFDRGWVREAGASMFYTERVVPAGRHVAELNYSLAQQAGASRPDAPNYPLRVPAGGAKSIVTRLHDLGIDGDYIVIAPGASWRAKCWPAKRYGEFCRAFEEQNNLRVVVIQGPGEQFIAEEVIREAAPARPVIITTTIEELMGLLARARCVIAADSGPLHLAAALGAPVVGLYGPTDPARNGPFVSRAVIVNRSLPEEVSYKRRADYSPSMLRITVEDVIAATVKLLKAPL